MGRGVNKCKKPPATSNGANSSSLSSPLARFALAMPFIALILSRICNWIGFDTFLILMFPASIVFVAAYHGTTDVQEHLDRKSLPKKLPNMEILNVNLFFLVYILRNSHNQFKLICAASLYVLYTLLIRLKDNVLKLDGERPLEALKLRRFCICVVYAVSVVFEMFGFIENMDRVSRIFLHVGSSLMVLVPLALQCSFGEFEAVMDSLPGTGKELKGKEKRRVITKIMSFTPVFGMFLLMSVGNPWKLAYSVLSFLHVSLMKFSSEKVNESKQESLVLLKMWRRVKNFLLISCLILSLVVIYHTQPAVYMRNSLCMLMCDLILIIVIVRVVGVELKRGNHFKQKRKSFKNGEDTGVLDSVRITADEQEGNLLEIVLLLILANFSILIVCSP